MKGVVFLLSIYFCAANTYNKLDVSKRSSVEFVALNAAITSLKTGMSSLTKVVSDQSKTINELQGQVAVLQSLLAKHSQTVAFMAYLTKTVTGTYHNIIFDDVKLNIGNGYNPYHGAFVVPVRGTYQFTVTACSASGHYVVLELSVNGSTVGKVFAGNDAYSNCNSKPFLATVNKGDSVYVQHEESGDYLLAAKAYGYPSFTGILIHAG